MSWRNSVSLPPNSFLGLHYPLTRSRHVLARAFFCGDAPPCPRMGVRIRARRDLGSRREPEPQRNARAGRRGAGHSQVEHGDAHRGRARGGAELDIKLRNSGDEFRGGAPIQYRDGDTELVAKRDRNCCTSTRPAGPEAEILGYSCDLAVGERKEIRLPAGGVERHNGPGSRRIALRIEDRKSTRLNSSH